VIALVALLLDLVIAAAFMVSVARACRPPPGPVGAACRGAA
jgi:hypothetical protein